jgi:hypothetical protein
MWRRQSGPRCRPVRAPTCSPAASSWSCTFVHQIWVNPPPAAMQPPSTRNDATPRCCSMGDMPDPLVQMPPLMSISRAEPPGLMLRPITLSVVTTPSTSDWMINEQLVQIGVTTARFDVLADPGLIRRILLEILGVDLQDRQWAIPSRRCDSLISAVIGMPRGPRQRRVLAVPTPRSDRPCRPRANR